MKPSTTNKSDSLKRIRLQVFLASAGLGSRRSCEALITQGKVRVNGKVVTELGSKVSPSDRVQVGSKLLHSNPKRYYLFNKPAGVITTMKEPSGRPCVGDFLQKLSVRVNPVGRLDRDVTGLLLLTNDGDLANFYLHPRNQIPKTYWAIVEGQFDGRAEQQVLKGVRSEDGLLKAKEAKLLTVTSRFEKLLGKVSSYQSAVEVTVCEGKKHFVKKLLLGAGHPVKKLCRVSFADFELGSLRPGEMREIDLD